MEETAECMGKHGWVAVGGLLRERAWVGGSVATGWGTAWASLGGWFGGWAGMLLTVFTARYRRRHHHHRQVLCEIAMH